METLTDFHFIRPYCLLLFIPLLYLLWLLVSKKIGHSNWENVCDDALLPHILIQDGGRHSRHFIYLFVLATSLIIFALAGPSWERIPQPVFRTESSLVVLLDLSRSMNAADIKPSRLERAKFKLTDILKQRQEGETALIVYAGEAFTVTPLTNDIDTIISQLPALTTDLMPIQGAKADKAITLAVDLLKQGGNGHGDILLMTDEVDAIDTPMKAKEALQEGYRVSVMAIGSKDGAPIPVQQGGFLKDRTGNIIVAKLDVTLLSRVASNGGGRFVELTLDDSDIQQLNNTFISIMNSQFKEQDNVNTDVWKEEGPWLLLLLLPLLSLAFRKGVILSILIIMLPLPKPVQALSWEDLWLNENQKAYRALNDGKQESAAEQFTDPEWKAAAQYQAGQYQQAIDTLKDRVDVKDLYNRGNALAKLGQYEEAIKHYEQALSTEPDHEDASYNKKLVEEALKKQQQEKQKSESNQDNQGEQQDQSQSSEQGQQSGDKKQSQQDDKNQTRSENERQQTGDKPHTDSSSDDKKQQQAGAEKEPSTDTQVDQGKSNEVEESQIAQSQQAKENEQEQADEQWLRRIPDDPGGLLRRKFLYQYKQRTRNSSLPEKSW